MGISFELYLIFHYHPEDHHLILDLNLSLWVQFKLKMVFLVVCHTFTNFEISMHLFYNSFWFCANLMSSLFQLSQFILSSLNTRWIIWLHFCYDIVRLNPSLFTHSTQHTFFTLFFCIFYLYANHKIQSSNKHFL